MYIEAYHFDDQDLAETMQRCSFREWLMIIDERSFLEVPGTTSVVQWMRNNRCLVRSVKGQCPPCTAIGGSTGVAITLRQLACST